MHSRDPSPPPSQARTRAAELARGGSGPQSAAPASALLGRGPAAPRGSAAAANGDPPPPPPPAPPPPPPPQAPLWRAGTPSSDVITDARAAATPAAPGGLNPAAPTKLTAGDPGGASSMPLPDIGLLWLPPNSDGEWGVDDERLAAGVGKGADGAAGLPAAASPAPASGCAASWPRTQASKPTSW
jgi:hypothetical protein